MKPSLIWYWLDEFSNDLFAPASSVPIPDPVHYRCLLATQVAIQGLSLPGINSANIIVVKMPWWDRVVKAGLLPSGAQFPAVLISPFGIEQADQSQGTNYRDDISYPCTVSVVQSPDNDYQLNLSKYLGWRQRIARGLRNQRADQIQNTITLNEVMTIRWQPSAIIDPIGWNKNAWISHMVFWFVSRELRGAEFASA